MFQGHLATGGSHIANQPFEEGYVVVPAVQALNGAVYGVRTHFVFAGEGEPLIMIHGGGPGASGASGWARTIPALSNRFRVFAIDLIGCGYTDKPLIDYSFQTQVNHVAGFIDALGMEQVRILGNSQGAYMAMKYALDHPRRVKQVALISTGTLANACGLSDEGKAAMLPRFDGSKESIRAFLSVIVNDPARLTDELVDSRYAVASLPGHKELMQSIGKYRQTLKDDPNEQQLFEVRERLAKFAKPWCMIWGGDDRSAPLDPLGNGMHKLYPHVPFHVVAGSGHQVQNDKPEECNRLLNEFFVG
jgi:pimeloyl-ACP methyl ester carboxylesterase